MRKPLITLALAAAAMASALLCAPSASAAGPRPCGAVVVAAGDWLGGQGVPVRSNGWGGSSCDGFSMSNRARQFGGGWQCVEIAARLYFVKGWGNVYAGGNGGARFIPEGSPNLEFHPNGSGYVPMPGDLVIENHGTYGHVSVVDRVRPNAIDAVEQNASWSGRKTYELEGSAASGAYGGGTVRGFMHSRRNRAFGPPLSGPIVERPAAPAIVEAPTARVGFSIEWQPAAPTVARVREYQVMRRRWIPGAGAWGRRRLVSVDPQATAYATAAAPGRLFRVRVRARNVMGWGAWSSKVAVSS